MSFFLGIFPPRDAIENINKVKEGVTSVFDGFEIPVRWSLPNTYHLTLIHFGESYPFYKRLTLKYKLKNISLKGFIIRFNTVKLGISRRYKELIYLDLLEGGDDMRKLLLELRSVLNVKNEGNFLPHLTLGRVSKELTDQEYANICRDLTVVSKNLNIKDIRFRVNGLELVKSEEGEYQVLISFSDFSSTSS
jgi:2'-5' RNA ligase